MIEIVSATRLSTNRFWTESALGYSLRRLERDKRITCSIAFENRRGLPEIYNARIQAPNSAEVLVFMHDDVWIEDFFLVNRILEGLEKFDIIGVAGNQRRVPNQAAWALLDTKLTLADPAFLSGAVAHGKTPFGPIMRWGESPAECELMDGLFLATKKSTLKSKNVLFDPTFGFHFYDLDFCRTAKQNGLRMGTWPISLCHQSPGAYGPDWHEKYRLYINKWGS